MRFLLRNAIRDRALESRRRRHTKKINRRPMIGGKPLPPGGTKFLRLHDFTPAMVDEIEHHQMVGNIQLLQQGRGGGEMDICALRKMLGWDAPLTAKKTGHPMRDELVDGGPEDWRKEAQDRGIDVAGLTGDQLVDAIMLDAGYDLDPDLGPQQGEDPSILVGVSVANVDEITDVSLNDDEEDSSGTVPADEPISAKSSAPDLPDEAHIPLNMDDLLDPENPPEVEHEIHAYTKDELMSLKGKDLREILVKLGGKIGSKKTKDALSEAILGLQPSSTEE